MAEPSVGLIVVVLFLIIHLYADRKHWYYQYPAVDVITHFMGGMVLGFFVKELALAVGLIFMWELLEALLVKENRKRFRETPMNKFRDVLAGFLGLLVGIEFL